MGGVSVSVGFEGLSQGGSQEVDARKTRLIARRGCQVLGRDDLHKCRSRG